MKKPPAHFQVRWKSLTAYKLTAYKLAACKIPKSENLARPASSSAQVAHSGSPLAHHGRPSADHFLCVAATARETPCINAQRSGIETVVLAIITAIA